MRIYTTVCSKASFGAFIQPAREGARNCRTMAAAAPRTMNNEMVEPMTLPHSSVRFSPISCPRIMVVPRARSAITNVMDPMSWDPVDTADTLAASENLPTIRKSAAP